MCYISCVIIQYNRLGVFVAKIKLKSIISVLVPLTLLAIFAVSITFPDYILNLTITPKSHAGIGTETHTLHSSTGEGSLKEISFSLKKVPSGIAPGLCTDEPGMTVVDMPFRLAETEVTGALWDAVRVSGASAFYTFSSVPQASGPNHPVEFISWREAIVFCNALSVALGFTPVYFRDESFTQPIRSAAELARAHDYVHVDTSSEGFRLPGSAEWELAARYIDGETWTPGGHPSGSTHPYYFDSRTSFFAVYGESSSSPVKSKASNKLGLYDMSGNVWEWCFDRFDWRHPVWEGLLEDEQAAAEAARKRVVRGGSWLGTFYRMQIGGEFGSLPDLEAYGQGLRVARSGW